MKSCKQELKSTKGFFFYNKKMYTYNQYILFPSEFPQAQWHSRKYAFQHGNQLHWGDRQGGKCPHQNKLLWPSSLAASVHHSSWCPANHNKLNTNSTISCCFWLKIFPIILGQKIENQENHTEKEQQSRKKMWRGQF